MPDAVDPAADPKSDPGGAVSAIARYRQLASWIITIFAAVGALLIAGSQLSSLGSLALDSFWHVMRLIGAVAGVGLALWAAFKVIGLALEILRPVELSLNQLVDDSLAKELEKQPGSLPFGATTVAEVSERFNRAMAHPGNSATIKKEWQDKLSELLDRAMYLKVRATFDSNWKKMGRWAGVGAAAITLFAFCANPKTDGDHDSASASTPPKPTAVTVSLTDQGKDTLTKSLGADCVSQDFEAISIGGDEQAPLLISVPSSTCELARFTLPLDQGRAVSTDAAPISAADDEDEEN